MKILLVEDDPDLAQLVKLHLENENIEILISSNGIDAWEIFKKNFFDFVILDIMIPGFDGYSLLRKIRNMSKIPIIFLTSKGDSSDIILGLGMGADDYIVKPFNPLEMIARIKAQYRRYKSNDNKLENNIIEIDEIKLCPKEFSLTVSGNEKKLNFREFKILKFLMENAGIVFTKKQIYETVWNEEYINNGNTIMVHISRIREKIESNPKDPKNLITIKGIGYKFSRSKINA